MDINKYKIQSNFTLKESIKILDKIGEGFLVIINNYDEVVGVFTDGDFRRAIIKGIDLETKIHEIINENFTFLKPNYSKKEVINLFNKNKFIFLPVIEDNKLIEIIRAIDFPKESLINKKKLDVPVVIMAGGKGTRMQPFTKVLPKPLIPINDKTILEIIIDNYIEFNIKKFFITINFKGNLIKAYLKNVNSDLVFNYIEEKKPLGTAGALKYLQGVINSDFFVSNCDILIKDDYSEIYDFHKLSSSMITMVCSVQHYKIPYGVCEVDKEGELKNIKEKPEYDFLVNTGMYVINPDVLKYIPKDNFYDITSLIEKIKKLGEKVSVYPISENSYIDIGQWKEYRKTVEFLSI